MEYGAVVSLPISVVPRKNSTFLIGRLLLVGVAVAESVIVPGAANTAPLDGAVSFAVIAHAEFANSNASPTPASPRRFATRLPPTRAGAIFVIMWVPSRLLHDRDKHVVEIHVLAIDLSCCGALGDQPTVSVIDKDLV